MNAKKSMRSARRIMAISIAAAAATPSVFAGQSQNPNNSKPAVTISLSGSTAMRNFTVSPGITDLTPGTSITLSDGNPADGTTTYTAVFNGSNTLELQLASKDFSQPDVTTGSRQNYSAIRLEWHEQGSVEGVLDMVNDQIGYVGGFAAAALVNPVTRNPVSTNSTSVPFSNPTWVNQTNWNGTHNGTTNFFVVPPATNPPTYAPNIPANHLPLAYSDYNTYNNPLAHPGQPANSYTYDANGTNLQGGQNKVQMAISDVSSVQAFSISGASGSMGATPLIAGYGKGNGALTNVVTSLPTNALATPGSSYQLQDQTALNMTQAMIDPHTGAAYGQGPWNTAGLNNLDNHRVAVTATLYVANPGTGLDKINRTDAQWLQTTGRLRNGVDFNMTTRDVGSGTRNVAAVNTGVDPSFAVGENDAGNGNSQLSGFQAADQASVGRAMLFSNKTAGGGQLRPTVQNNRMSIGTLGMSDAFGNGVSSTALSPIRALDYTDAASDGTKAADPNNVPVNPATGIANSGYIARVSAQNITSGAYAIYQNETYVTVKAPSAAFAGATQAQWANTRDFNDANSATVNAGGGVGTTTTGIKGDTFNNDVARFRFNITQTVSNFTPNALPTSAANPADSALANSFILPQMMAVEKTTDGVGVSSANPIYDPSSQAFLTDPTNGYSIKFHVDDPTQITSGNNSTYGNGKGSNGGAFPAGAINITDNDPAGHTTGNYLFGNFNQNGIRDFSAIKAALPAVQALYNADNTASVFTASVLNSTKISGLAAPLGGMKGQDGTTGATKGDLIVMGDYNGDGVFDGKDIFALAHGAAVSDAPGTPGYTGGTLSIASGQSFGDSLRGSTLRKNDALDYMKSQTGNTADAFQNFLRQSAESAPAQANDAANHYLNAFNKLDVDHNGKLDRNDAALVDKFIGKDFTNINHQLNATMNDPFGSSNQYTPSGTQLPFNLIDANLSDGKSTIDRTDFEQVRAALGAKLIVGDANFDGTIDNIDLTVVLQNFGVSTSRWGLGNFENGATVDNTDLTDVLQHFGTNAAGITLPADAALLADPAAMRELAAHGISVVATPEPGSIALLGLGAVGLLRRRRSQASQL